MFRVFVNKTSSSRLLSLPTAELLLLFSLNPPYPVIHSCLSLLLQLRHPCFVDERAVFCFATRRLLRLHSVCSRQMYLIIENCWNDTVRGCEFLGAGVWWCAQCNFLHQKAHMQFDVVSNSGLRVGSRPTKSLFPLRVCERTWAHVCMYISVGRIYIYIYTGSSKSVCT
jgi:hypothetical protein